MFRGFATLNLYADDLVAARDWYSQLFGVEAYYAYPAAPAAPAYVEFRIGDDADEIGFIDRRYAPPGARTGSPGGAVMHWHVDDLPGALARLLELGATEYQPIVEHGDGSGFATASVVDPFGNVLGVMHNPHFLEIAQSREPAVETVS
ncbi:VOC family protein [Pseudonocardia humida]|uniref:VOC family protein n=1 Tax=Pseudonocardia humida TaxID=2800819 RepID=A0ABT0ZWC0_9PSEU|nr:VOC family protein [Pseudonocardia humida]MCO1655045.1 VOC family protein [Pseudonocardia humida]